MPGRGMAPVPPTLTPSSAHPRLSVVVGAPRANTSQPGVAQAGAVFLCSWPTNETLCHPLPIDTAGAWVPRDDGWVQGGAASPAHSPSPTPPGDETETQNTLKLHTYKSYQWLGASVTSWDGKLVVGAPGGWVGTLGGWKWW